MPRCRAISRQDLPSVWPIARTWRGSPAGGEIATLFTDVAGFTTLAESIEVGLSVLPHSRPTRSRYPARIHVAGAGRQSQEPAPHDDGRRTQTCRSPHETMGKDRATPGAQRIHSRPCRRTSVAV